MAAAKGPLGVPPFELGYSATLQGVLGFKFEPFGRYASHPLGWPFVARPMKVFTPKGLALWGAPQGAKLGGIVSSMHHELLVSLDPVPARLFAGFASFEALRRQVELDADAFASWGTFCTISPGCELVLFLSDATRDQCETVEVAMWGMTI